jgi:predicted DCC family thiol-disulfide oxidoreductase YuxK
MTQSWQPKDAPDLPDGLILFDGVCVLCSRSAQFVLRHDPGGWFLFTPIQSAYGRALAQRLGISTDMPQTNAVIERGRAHFKSGTAIEVLRRLPRWRWTRLLSFVPRALGDFIYDRVARNRYRLFGRTETCMMPTPSIARRFVLDADTERMAVLAAERQSPFEYLLGSDFARLPEPARRVHGLVHSMHSAGRADVHRAPGLLARVLCTVAGLPPSGRDIAVTVAFHPDGSLREFWERRFGGRRYSSTLRAGDPRAPDLLVEHFGPFDLEFKLSLTSEGAATRLHWSAVGWRFLGVRLPRQTVPRIHCVESGDGKRFTFDIDVAFPLIGEVIRYSGELTMMSTVAAHNMPEPARIKSA